MCYLNPFNISSYESADPACSKHKRRGSSVTSGRHPPDAARKYSVVVQLA